MLSGRNGLQSKCEDQGRGDPGAALGVAGMYTMPAFPAQDIINALAIGIVSGLAATGVNQAIKQIKQ